VRMCFIHSYFILEKRSKMVTIFRVRWEGPILKVVPRTRRQEARRAINPREQAAQGGAAQILCLCQFLKIRYCHRQFRLGVPIQNIYFC